jgi:3',5'-cyclic AMP phosphodiesterase CpdA
MRFLHVSDLHYHRNPADNKAADTTLTFIKKTYPKHHLIVTGDITDDGHPEQYENARKALLPFRESGISICPGNHDFGAAGNFYSRERAERFDELLSRPLGQPGTFTGDQTPVVTMTGSADDRVMLIGLDTNLETEQPFDFACGEVGKKQLDALDSILANRETCNLLKVVFFHHHPFMVNDPFMELRDAEQLGRVLYRRVNVVLFGHKHVSHAWEDRWGVRWTLAADNTPGKDYAREIVVEHGEFMVKDARLGKKSQN